MHKIISVLAMFTLGAGASGLCAAEDLTVVSNVTANGKPGGTETNYISSDHIRNSRSEGSDVIIDLKSGVMTNINTKKKTYYTVTKQDMESMSAKMNERMNDPKVKQAMAAFQGIGNSMASSAEVKKTGVKRTVAGFACEEWVITMGAMMTITECAANDLKYPVESWQALADFSESMRKSMSAFSPAAKSGADLAEKMKSIKGFPVASSTVIDAGVMKTTTSSEVTEIRRTALSSSTWDVPAGFTQVENPMLKSLEQHGR